MIQNFSLEWTVVSLTTYYQNKETTIDLLNSFQEIVLRESINSKLLTGTIEFKDSSAIFNTELFYVSESFLNIKFKDLVNDDTVTYKFRITSVENITKDLNSELITLGFAEESVLLMYQEFAGYLDKQTVSDWIKDFSKNKLKKEVNTIEDTTGKLTLAIPLLRFNFIQKYLNWYSKSKNSTYYYLYFTTSTKKVFYCTYEYLMAQDVGVTFKQVPYQKADLDPAFFAKHGLKMNSDLQTFSSNGAFGGTQTIFDFEKKEPKITTNTYSDLVGKSKITNSKYSLFAKSLDNKQNKYYYSEDANIYKFELNHVIQTIQSGTVLSFGTYGQYGRTCGMVAKVTLDDMNDPSKDYNEELTGKYLITSVVHHMFRGAMKQEFVLLRTGLTNQNKDLVKV